MVLFAVGYVAARELSDAGQPTVEPPSSTTTPTSQTIPAALRHTRPTNSTRPSNRETLAPRKSLPVAVFLACAGAMDRASRAPQPHASRQRSTRSKAQPTAPTAGAAAEQLAQLLATIDELRARGQLSQAAAIRIRHAAEAVNSQLALLPPPTTTTTTPPPEDDTRKNNKPGHGNGQGNPHNESD